LTRKGWCWKKTEAQEVEAGELGACQAHRNRLKDKIPKEQEKGKTAGERGLVGKQETIKTLSRRGENRPETIKALR